MAAALLAALVVSACGDDLDLTPNWEARVDTVTLYTTDRADYQGLPAAYDLHGQRTVRIEDPTATGNWEFGLLVL